MLTTGQDVTLNPTTAQLGQALHDFGEHWQLEQVTDTGAWVAIRRPEPPAFTVVTAATLAELTDKLRERM